MKQLKDHIDYLVKFQNHLQQPRVKAMKSAGLRASSFLERNPLPAVVQTPNVVKVKPEEAKPKAKPKAKGKK